VAGIDTFWAALPEPPPPGAEKFGGPGGM